MIVDVQRMEEGWRALLPSLLRVRDRRNVDIDPLDTEGLWGARLADPVLEKLNGAPGVLSPTTSAVEVVEAVIRLHRGVEGWKGEFGTLMESHGLHVPDGRPLDGLLCRKEGRWRDVEREDGEIPSIDADLGWRYPRREDWGLFVRWYGWPPLEWTVEIRWVPPLFRRGSRPNRIIERENPEFSSN